MIVRLKPAIMAYKVSDVATPSPETNPDFQVLLTVLLIQSTPNGPRGIETAIPIMMPSNKRFILIGGKNNKLQLIYTMVKKRKNKR